jgi:hypothetical protein
VTTARRSSSRKISSDISKELVAKETNHKNASEERRRLPMHRFFQRFPFLLFATVKACIETICANVETADGNDMVVVRVNADYFRI